MQPQAPMKKIPYFPISQFYKEKFGARVHKISVGVAETCPNREGLRGMQTCNFCDAWGSAAYSEHLTKPLSEQIEAIREILQDKRRAKKFLVYFQAYTTTFSRLSRLQTQMTTAANTPNVVGVVVATRPDCVSNGFFTMLNEYAEKTFVGLELGVQSFNEERLIWMRRGHTAAQSLRAITMAAKQSPQVDLGIHLIFGGPGETEQEIRDVADRVNDLPIHNVKLHHLHVLKNTPLEEHYRSGLFTPISMNDYLLRCQIFLQHLRPDIAIHRLAAFSPRWEELVAPEWTSNKMKLYQAQLDYMVRNGAYQGQHYHSKHWTTEQQARLDFIRLHSGLMPVSECRAQESTNSPAPLHTIETIESSAPYPV